MIMQYLQDEGYTTSFLTMQDEANVKLAEQQTQRSLFKRMRKAILEGDWVEVDKLSGKITFQQQKSFLYAAYREQFIELIEAQEYQKAFTHLTKRLKPLEASAASLGEFKDLCYLLTCRSVHEVLPNWQGAAAAREALLAQLATMLELDNRRQEGTDGVSMPARRLVTLLEQAAAYQVTSTAINGEASGQRQSRMASAAGDAAGGDAGGDVGGVASSDGGGVASGPMSNGSARSSTPTGASAGGGSAANAADLTSSSKGVTTRPSPAPSAATATTRAGGRRVYVESLLRDYASPRVPNTPDKVLGSPGGEGVKSVAWLDGSGGLLLAGGNDMLLRVWSARSGQCLGALEGHTARIWQLAVSRKTIYNHLIASAAADGTVRLWRLGSDLSATDGSGGGGGGGGGGFSSSDASVGTLSGHVGDVYSVCFHPTADQVVTCGYDRSVRLFDAAAGIEQRALVGHELPAREAIFSSTGNLIVSGGKDATVRFWDVRSALCVRKLGHSLGEVTSVRLSECGTQLLASSKDNSVRLWDVRAARPLRAFKGHQNTSKNFVRARFGPSRDLVLSGSEDGSICMWDVTSGEMAHRLVGHTDVAYDACWEQGGGGGGGGLMGGLGLLASCSHDGTVRTWRYDEAGDVAAGEGGGETRTQALPSAW